MKKIILMGFAVLLLASCKKENISESISPAESPTATISKAKVTRPFTGDISNAGVPDAPGVSCSGAFPISGKNFIYGNVSHMGRLKSGSFGIAQVCEVTDFDTYLALNITYKEIWVAANGDQLYSNTVIDVVGNPLDGGATGTWTGSSVITGGTGRFEGATGHFNPLNGHYFADGTATWSVKGEITY